MGNGACPSLSGGDQGRGKDIEGLGRGLWGGSRTVAESLSRECSEASLLSTWASRTGGPVRPWSCLPVCPGELSWLAGSSCILSPYTVPPYPNLWPSRADRMKVWRGGKRVSSVGTFRIRLHFVLHFVLCAVVVIVIVLILHSFPWKLTEVLPWKPCATVDIKAGLSFLLKNSPKCP